MKIAIYISQPIKDRLKDIQQKYRLSISTITQILFENFKIMFASYENDFFTTYLDKEHRNKTIIKPRIKEDDKLLTYTKGEIKIISHIASNLLYKWATRQYEWLFNEFVNKKLVEKWTKKVEKIMYETKEDIWDYNDWIRKQIKLECKGHTTLQKYREQF